MWHEWHLVVVYKVHLCDREGETYWKRKMNSICLYWLGDTRNKSLSIFPYKMSSDHVNWTGRRHLFILQLRYFYNTCMRNELISILRKLLLIFVQKKRERGGQEAVIFVSVFLHFITNQHVCSSFKISLRICRWQYFTFYEKFEGS